MNAATSLRPGLQSTLAASDACTKAPEVTCEVNDLSLCGSAIDSLITRLEERLTGILRSLPPPSAGQGAIPEPVLVPLAETLRRERRGFEQSISRLESLIARVEL